MKALGLSSAFVFLLLLVMMMAMMVQAKELFGETRADPNLPPRENNGILYYIRADRFKDEELALKNCAADGGKLVEIGTQSEFNFIADYISSLQNHGSGNYSTFIGGKYQPEVSKWVFPTAGTPVPFFRPSYELRNYHPSWGKQCLVLVYDMQFDTCGMSISPCIADGYFYNIMYMCEKVYAPYYQLTNADPNIRAVEFRDKIYYIHKKLYTDYEANRQDCEADGGMMAEINDWLEFVVVQKYLKSHFDTTYTSFYIVFIGGKKTSNGWVLPSTNQSLPYIKWGPYEPSKYLYGYDCLCLRGNKDFQMASMYCLLEVDGIPEYRFLCEKPKES